jgi:hypothetical protein
VPVAELTSSATTAPAPATYAFRQTGRLLIGGAAQESGSLATTSTRTISRVPPPTSAANYVEYDVVATVSGESTTSRYRVVPLGSVPDPGPLPGPPTPVPTPPPPRAGGPTSPGLYLMSVTAAGQTAVPYSGDAGQLIVSFPISEGNAFSNASSDGSHHVEYTSTVDKKVRIDACGEPIDAWQVTLKGTISQADQQQPVVTFTATYSIAPQYGALTVAESVVADSASSVSDSVHQETTATINVLPKPIA